MSAEAMLMPLDAALELAGRGGPAIVAGIKARARAWWGAPPRSPKPWDSPAETALEALLEE